MQISEKHPHILVFAAAEPVQTFHFYADGSAPDAVFSQIGYPNMSSVVGKEGDQRGHFAQLRIGIRTEQYSMDFTYMKDGMKMPVEDGNLFDMLNDPGELRNLWNDPDHQDIKAKMAKRMDRWFEEIDKPPVLFESVEP